MRPGRPVVCGEPDLPVSLSDQARRLGAPLQRIGNDFFAEPLDSDCWRYRHRDGISLDLPTPPRLPGRVQLNNAASALTVLHHLGRFDPEIIRHALENVSLTGRFQVLDEPVDTVLDIAHNPEGAINLARNLRRYRPGRPLHAVFSALQEKDVPNILGPLSPLVKSWHLSEVDSPRAIPLQTLRILAESCRLPEVHVHPTVTEAYREAASRAGQEGTVGSVRLGVFGRGIPAAPTAKTGIGSGTGSTCIERLHPGQSRLRNRLIVLLYRQKNNVNIVLLFIYSL